MPRTVVVVEDNPITRKMMVVALQLAGYSAFGAGDGASALALVEQKQPDLVIEDLILPDMDGIELARRIRALPRGRECVLVALSGLASKLEEARTVTPGFAQQLFKPMEPSKLIAILEELIPQEVPATETNGGSHPDASPSEDPLPPEQLLRVNQKLARDAAATTAQLAIMTAAATVVARNQDLNTLLSELLARTLDATGVSMGAIYLTNDEGRIELACQLGYPIAVAARLGDFFGQRELLETALTTGHSIRMRSTEHGEVTQEPGDAPLCVLVPLAVAGQALGVLVIASARRDLSDDWVETAWAVGVQIAQAVVSARSMVQLSASEQHYRTAAHDLELALARERAAREEAEAANLSKSQFLAVMSHELRTPLNAIGGYVDLVQLGIHGPVTQEQREDLQRVKHNSRHLLGMISEILDFTEVDARRARLAEMSVPLAPTLHGAEALVAPQFREKGLQLSVEACDESICVRATQAKLTQVLANLLSNALKFTPHGGRVALASKASDRTVAVRIEDTGPGIAADQLERIFEPFYQVDRSLTRSHGGIGLGLAISRDLVRAMGGDIGVESVLGRGSTFTVTLPRA